MILYRSDSIYVRTLEQEDEERLVRWLSDLLAYRVCRE